MSSFAEYRSSVIEPKVAEIRRLYATVDPEETPFNSKYEKSLVRALLDKRAEFQEDKDDVTELIGELQLSIGANFIETEENHGGEVSLGEAIETLEPLGSRAAILMLEAQNQLGVLWANRNVPETAWRHLQAAMQTYPVALQREEQLGPFGWRRITDISALLAAQAAAEADALSAGAAPTIETVDAVAAVAGADAAGATADAATAAAAGPVSVPRRASRVEELHTMTLFYMAQVCQHSGKGAQAAKYCQLTLKRQLLTGVMFDPEQWARNCASLSWYFTSRHRWALAEHCLAAADKIMPPTAKFDSIPGLYSTWAKHLVHRLKHAATTAAKAEKGAAEGSGEAEAAPVLDADGPDETTMFDSLDLPPPRFADAIVTFDQARELFLAAMEYIRKAKEYFVLDGFVTEHLDLLSDESNLYRYLIPFEQDPERKIKMLRRRAALFEPLLTQLNPNVYQDTLRQFMFDLGDIHGDVADIRSGHKHPVKKINEAALQTIKYQQMFLRSFEKDGKFPDKLEDGYVEAVLASHFALARMFTKLVPPSREAVVSNMQRALDLYKWIIEYRKRNNLELFAYEASICTEMVELLPLKMKAVAAGLA